MGRIRPCFTFTRRGPVVGLVAAASAAAAAAVAAATVGTPYLPLLFFYVLAPRVSDALQHSTQRKSTTAVAAAFLRFNIFPCPAVSAAADRTEIVQPVPRVCETVRLACPFVLDRRDKASIRVPSFPLYLAPPPPRWTTRPKRMVRDPPRYICKLLSTKPLLHAERPSDISASSGSRRDISAYSGSRHLAPPREQRVRGQLWHRQHVLNRITRVLLPPWRPML